MLDVARDFGEIETVYGNHGGKTLSFKEIVELVEYEEQQPRFLSTCVQWRNKTVPKENSTPYKLHTKSCGILYSEDGVAGTSSRSLMILTDKFYEKLCSYKISNSVFAQIWRNYRLIRSVNNVPIEEYLELSGAEEFIQHALESIFRARNSWTQTEQGISQEPSLLAVELTSEHDLRFLSVKRPDIRWWIQLKRFDDWYTRGEVISGKILIRP